MRNIPQQADFDPTRPTPGVNLNPAKTPVDPESIANAAIADAACVWLAPWARGAYPGRRRLIQAALPRPVTTQAVDHWRRGKRRMPAWAALSIAGVLRSRARLADDLADALERHAAVMDATPPMRRGWQLVDMATNRDKRGNWRKG